MEIGEGVAKPLLYATICRQSNMNEENFEGMRKEAKNLLSRRHKDGGERNRGSLWRERSLHSRGGGDFEKIGREK